MTEQIIQRINEINQEIALKGLKIVLPNGQQMDSAWLPEEIKQMLIDEHNRTEKEKTGLALVKYFGGSGTWWVSEYDPEIDLFFGKAEIHFKEYGYTQRRELRETRFSRFLWIERDFWFEPRPLEEC